MSYDILYAEAASQTPETLPEFCENVMKEAENNVEKIINGLNAIAIASVSAYSNSIELPIPPEMMRKALPALFARKYGYPETITWVRVQSYDGMLLPGFASQYDRSLTPKQASILQELAEKALKRARDDEKYRNKFDDEVFDHWANIIAGNMPYGYFVIED